jgi:hypothetical protein
MSCVHPSLTALGWRDDFEGCRLRFYSAQFDVLAVRDGQEDL